VKGRGGGLLLLGALLAAVPARADRGALSFDLSAGGAGLNLPAPYAISSGETFGVGFEGMLGVRYAVLNELEFTLAAYFEPNVTYTHDNITVAPNGGPHGDLTHSLYLFGVVGGVRYVTGSVWKLVMGLEGGWCHRVYSQIEGNGQLALVPSFPDFTTDNIVIQPLLGVEWAFADHWSLSLIPRFTVLIGPDPTIGVSVMLSISYSWFL
jgi:hypothetical protein